MDKIVHEFLSLRHDLRRQIYESKSLCDRRDLPCGIRIWGSRSGGYKDIYCDITPASSGLKNKRKKN
jgi:hypothetical protein